METGEQYFNMAFLEYCTHIAWVLPWCVESLGGRWRCPADTESSWKYTEYAALDSQQRERIFL
jgi:hypothetical protein